MTESQSKMAQAYGYMVCLIAVVVGLVSLAGLTNSLFDYADPVHSDRWSAGRPIGSYNAYRRAYYDRQPRPAAVNPADAGAAPRARNDSVPETMLRQMYQEDRTDHVETTRFRALKSLAGAFLLLVVSIVLFSIHWKWLRRQSARTA